MAPQMRSGARRGSMQPAQVTGLPTLFLNSAAHLSSIAAPEYSLSTMPPKCCEKSKRVPKPVMPSLL